MTSKPEPFIYTSIPPDPNSHPATATTTVNYVILPYYPRTRHLLLRRILLPLSLFLLFTFSLFILFPSNPNLKLARIRLNHIQINSSNLHHLSLDLSLSLTIRVRNPDFFSLNYNSLDVAISYRGRELGVVRSDGGKINARQSSYIDATLVVDGFEVLHDFFYLIEDVAAGKVPFDTVSNIEGKLGLFFFKIPIQVDCGGDGVDYSSGFETSTLFKDEDALYEWAKATAAGLGFILVKSSKKKQRDGRPYVYFRCNRAGPNRSANRDLSQSIRKNTKSQGCECPFGIKGMVRKEGDGWVVVVKAGVHGTHNHPFIVYPQGHRQLSYLSPESKILVRELTTARGQPRWIMSVLKDRFPDLYPTIRQVYNERMKMRKEMAEGRDLIQQFLHLANEEKYVHWILIDPDTRRIRHAFMAHPLAANCLRTWPHVILMDSTYKTNRYKMPMFEIVGVTPTNHTFLIAYVFMRKEDKESYRWVFDKLRTLIGAEFEPTALVTDREAGLLAPLAEIFPRSHHLLCTWHINKDVEAYVSSKTTKSIGQRFKRGRWKDVIEATSEAEYYRALQNLKDAFCVTWPFIEQYLESTWLPHKEKFVRAWTNKVLHFGQTTTNRVESQHSVIKKWIETPKGALDTIFSSVHRAMEIQHDKIKKHLEDSRRRSAGPKVPFQHLEGHVSHFCIDILTEELMRMRQLSDEVFLRCGCALLATHGLPCACVMKRATERGGPPIYRDHIHPFWMTLVIGESVDMDAFADESEQDLEWFRELVDKVKVCDPATRRMICRILDGELHPEELDIGEPEVNEAPKGRPAHYTGPTSRNLSRFEYVAKSKQSKFGKGLGKVSGNGNSNTSTPSKNESVKSMSIDDYWYTKEIPSIILPFVERIVDVVSDGNCGFRVVADWCFDDQNRWPLVREMIANEVAAKSLYRDVYFDDHQRAVHRIRWDGGPVGEEHWMQVMSDLFPIAQIWNVAVSLFYVADGFLTPCVTVLPWHRPSTVTAPSGELAIGYIHSRKHYVRLVLSPDSPLPPVAALWYGLRDETVYGWDSAYAHRVTKWFELVNLQ